MHSITTNLENCTGETATIRIIRSTGTRAATFLLQGSLYSLTCNEEEELRINDQHGRRVAHGFICDGWAVAFAPGIERSARVTDAGTLVAAVTAAARLLASL